MIDALITALVIGSAFNGMRRGFIKEALVFALWIPIYAVSVMLVINTYKPAGDAQNASAVHDILMLLGFIFLLGSVFIFVLNKTIIQPWMQKRRLHSTKTIDTFMGFVLGGARFLVILFITVMIYDIFFSPFSLTGTPDSTYIKEAYKKSVPVKRWLIEEGYINIEIILYDSEFEDKGNKKNNFMKDLEGITESLR